MANLTVADLLTDLVGALRQLPLPVLVTAEELCEVLWLRNQELGTDSPPVAGGGAPSPVPPDPPGAPHGERDVRQEQKPKPVPGYLPQDLPGDGGTIGAARRVALRDAPALPQARELSRALRPLRLDAIRTHLGEGVDEEATAERIARTRIRDLAWQVTRRRRLDLDLVLDVGGSGPVWRQLATEMRTMLAINGAFRSVRFWDLDSDSAAVPLRPAGAGGDHAGYPKSSLYQAPRKPLIVVLTDGTGRGWQDATVHEPLRQWAAHGTVLLVQLLPTSMWDRTALPALPVTFRPADDGYHSGRRIDVDPVDLCDVGLKQADLRAAAAIPVIGLSPAWLRSWLPLVRGNQAGAVPGYALLIPPAGRKPAAAGRPVTHDAVALTARERVQRYMLTASPDARRLAQLLSLTAPDLAVMRKVRSELLPGSKPEVMAEFMLGGLVYWRKTAGTLAPSDTLRFMFHSREVLELLQERPGGVAERERDRAAVNRAILADRVPGPIIGVIVPLQREGQEASGLVPEGAVPILVPGISGDREETERQDPEALEDPEDLGLPIDPEHSVKPLRIGLWGSTQSGRTTFLTVLGTVFKEWTGPENGEQWRVVAASRKTSLLLEKWGAPLLNEQRFPPASAPLPGGEPMSFRLERRRPRGRGLVGWLRPERVADITVALQDRAGQEWVGAKRSVNAVRYLANSDALVYFFDPTHDTDLDDADEPPREWRSADFFNVVETDLGMLAAREGRVHKGFLPQHIAVCVPKLDEQPVFDRALELMDSDPGTKLPWVSPVKARLLFEMLANEQRSVEADYLPARLRRTFDPKRTSYHALSSVGFWVPEDGELNWKDVCNVVRVPSSPGAEPERRLRGPIRPVHILDPLISLVGRAGKRRGRP